MSETLRWKERSRGLRNVGSLECVLHALADTEYFAVSKMGRLEGAGDHLTNLTHLFTSA